MNSWHLNHTAREANHEGYLAAYWVGNQNTKGVPNEKYKRIWPYHLAQKLFYNMPFTNLEEQMRWLNLPFYDKWIENQNLPKGVTVVQAPMGSCESLFRLANQSSHKILKVFDAPNSHPTNLFDTWQRECDLHAPGFTIPIPSQIKSRIIREIGTADVILCPSLFVRDTMVQNGVPFSKCFVSHFGVDTSIFKKRERLPDHPVFISVGSLTLRKGHHYLFQAFAKVKTEIPDAELICIGDVRPDFQRELKKWKGTFTHHVGVPHSELANILAEATAFVLPSLEEGFARVLSEAMACGLPILASYESGATTVVRDGEEGVIIQPKDIDGIARSMIHVARNHQDNLRMGEAAYIAGGIANTWGDYTRRLLSEYSLRLAHL